MRLKTNKIFKISLIGLGRQGQEHMKALLSLQTNKAIKLSGICDNDPKVLSQHAGIETNKYTDYKQMLQQEKPNLVILCVPNYCYRKIIEYCTKERINILKEKPLAISYEEGNYFIELSKKAGILFEVAQQRQYNPYFVKAKKWLNCIQPIEYINYEYTLNDTTNSWYWNKALGGGCWLNIGWHICDVISSIINIPYKIHLRVYKQAK